jgi:hypothetical protein
MKKNLATLVMLAVLCLTNRAGALDAGDFDDLQGYTVLKCTHATGTIEGADFDKLIKLDNGMIFEFHSYSYFYAYHPDVVVFAKDTVFQNKSFTLYKLVIGDEDEVFDVTRIH